MYKIVTSYSKIEMSTNPKGRGRWFETDCFCTAVRLVSIQCWMLRHASSILIKLICESGVEATNLHIMFVIIFKEK